MFFPHPLLADPSGVLAVGGDLSAQRLRLAYAYGVFPWFDPDEPIMWWFPDPRAVLYPNDLVISKSLRRTLRKHPYTVTSNTAFPEVICACREIARKGQNGSWISDDMLAAYTDLHGQGIAHSVEVWDNGQLVGGLYGLALGKIFFGESMFSARSDASKIALVHLVARLKEQGFWLIDCQQDTPHLRSMGASLVTSGEFYQIIRKNQVEILQSEGLLEI